MAKGILLYFKEIREENLFFFTELRVGRARAAPAARRAARGPACGGPTHGGPAQAERRRGQEGCLVEKGFLSTFITLLNIFKHSLQLFDTFNLTLLSTF